MYNYLKTTLVFIAILTCTTWFMPAHAEEAIPTAEVMTSTPAISATLVLRYQDQIIWSGEITLASTTYRDSINNIDYSLDSSTVFSALVLADQQSDAFAISNAQLSPNGFYVRCLNITINNLTDNKCDNWQYVVNSNYPPVGMDKKELLGGENIYIYFGDRYTLTTDTTTIATDEILTTTLKEYSYQTNDWVAANNQLVLATEPIKPDYSNWPPTTIAEATTTDGVALFNFSATGTYYITLPDSYWPGVIISVTSTITSTQTNIPDTNSGGGGSNSPTNEFVSQTTINETVEKLLNFIKAKQESDGKIIDGGTSDWLAMSFGAKNLYAQDIKNGNASLFSYIYNYPITELDNELNNCTAYPRHMLALLASGVATTDTKITALRSKLDACVVNNTFGANGINDDIFGLIAALAIGENANAIVPQTTLAAITTNQQPDGGFAYPGPFEAADLTAVAINALKYAQNKGMPIDSSIFTRAKQYLKTQQLADGGWGFGTSDALTTGWATMGINALGEGQGDWFATSGKNPWHILTTLETDHYTQSWDGNVDWFATKHAIPALLGKSWPIILSPINTTQNRADSSSVGGSNPTTSTATENTSIIITTSTPTSTAISVVAETSTEPIPVLLGEVLGEKIITQISVKPVARKKITVVQNTVIPKVTTGVSETETETTTTIPAESVIASSTENTIDNSPDLSVAKIILIISGGGTLLIGLYIGLKSLKK